MSNVKDQIRALLDQVQEDDEVLEQVKQLLDHAIGGEGEYASDDEIVTYDLETSKPITMREHVEMMERDLEESEREDSFITLEELRKKASEW